jgi:hypothetical protein
MANISFHAATASTALVYLRLIYLRLINDMTSARLDTFDLNRPRTELVTVKLPGLRTPRIVMQV